MALQSSTARAERKPKAIPPAATETPKPLLASEVLREELAPLEPARQTSRLWLLVVAVTLTALAVAFRWGIGLPAVRLDAATVSFSAAGALAAVAVLPFPYALRAGLMLLIGGALAALGFRGAGPLAGLAMGSSAFAELARLVMLSTLPAALFFRARYRAFGPARALLTGALVLSLPFVGLELSQVVHAGAPVLIRISGAINVVLVGLTLFGFMGSGSTGAGSLWACLVLGAAPAEVALRQLTPVARADGGLLVFPATALALLSVAILTSVGLFQLLAAVLGPTARQGAAPLKSPEPEDSALEDDGGLS